MTTHFPPNSRYADTPVALHERADGTPVAYLRRRLVPQPERFATLQWHVCMEHERLDNIAARRLGDPTLFWRLCDANRALRPSELTATIGRRLRITLPEGIPGVPDA